MLLTVGSISAALLTASRYLGRRGSWVDFCWVCATGISKPLPRYSLFMVYLWPIIDPISVTFGQMTFLISKSRKKAELILVTLLKMPEKATPLGIPVMKMRLHPAAHPQSPITRKCPTFPGVGICSSLTAAYFYDG